MKLTCDPDEDSKQNMELLIKILQAKIKDRFDTDYSVDELARLLFKIIRERENGISLKQLKKKVACSDVHFKRAISLLQKRGSIYEEKEGSFIVI